MIILSMINDNSNDNNDNNIRGNNNLYTFTVNNK